MKACLLYFFLFFSFANSLYAQEKCGTMLLLHNKTYHSREADAFEEWVAQKRMERRLNRSTQRTSDEVTIPVVVHIIHNGQTLGTGVNIPTDQVLSQIDILNADYRRTNADASETLPEFVPVAADAEINFQLAVRDPEGLPTTGIVRVEGTRPSYSLSSGQLLSDISYWPSEDYLNIWVTNLGSGLLGYAQFPVSNLEGMDTDRVSNPLTDGVVIDYEYFGRGFNTDDFSQGRTATHEIGHYLGLRHIWGDGLCGATDYCDDTPDQERSTSGCPDLESSCGSNDMTQNFMDYTNDICMNLFTNDQRERMHVILENSPRRASLLSSAGLIPVTTLDNDLGVRQWVALYNSSCGEVLSPVVEVRNHGNTAIQQFEATLSVNGSAVETLIVNDLNLPFRGLQTIQFSDVELSTEGDYQLDVSINSVNGTVDQNPDNNTLTEAIFYTLPVTGDFNTDFETANNWNLQSGSVLGVANAPSETTGNNAAVFNFFSSNETLGTTSLLESPIIKINPSANPRLEFKYAHNHPEDNFAEALFVVVSTDCGLTYPPANTVFQSFGSGLNTSDQSDNALFIPSGENEWETANISLAAYSDANFIRVGFIGQNGLGNNLYIDDILVSAGPNADYDMAIDDIANSPVVTCEPDISTLVTVINNGNNAFDAFTLDYSINGVASGSELYGGVQIDPFERRTVTLPISGLSEGSNNTIEVTASILGQTDEFIEDNTLSVHSYFDQSEISFPYRLDLNQPDWFEYEENGRSAWTFSESYASIDLSRETSGSEYWLISPAINPSTLDGLSMAFEVAYPHMQGRNDRLIVAIDWDCDGIFDEELLNRSGEQLETVEYTAGFEPTDDDWRREFIDLSNFLIFNEVRIAIKAVSAQGTSIYLRDVEVYPSNRPSIGITNELRIYPNPATDLILVKFNLPRIEPATIRLVDMKGQVLFDQTFENTLNQTYELLTANENNGMYLMQIITPTFNSTERVIIWR
ncbi:MAG: M43 family zinc metalloprotease [Bacteroidota bacterium]